MRVLLRATAAAVGVIWGSGHLLSEGPSSSFRIVRGPYLQPGLAGAVSVVWYTDVPVEGELQWRRETTPWTEEPAFADETGLRQEAILYGLQEGASYSYRVVERGAAVANLSSQSEFSFRAPARDGVRFVAFGDSGSGTSAQRAVAHSITRENPPPDFVLLVGDVVYPEGADSDYDAKFFAPFGLLLSRFPFYSAIGNHDYGTQNGAPYLAVFSLPRNGPAEVTPETVYWFERGGVHFTVHDSNLGRQELRQHVAPWHAAAVRASRTRFRIAALHHSPYSSGPNSETPAVEKVREFFPPLFSSTGVDLVLAGHDHLYERTRPLNGVAYVTTGAGGGTLYPRVRYDSYTEAFSGDEGRHGYTALQVGGTNLTLRHVDIAGCIVDRMGIYKPIGEGDSWRIFPGGTDPPTDWAQLGFQDRHWASAALPIGFGNPDLASSNTEMLDSHLTLYARTSFPLAPGRVNQLILRIRYDDGFVAYLNGVEVARRNVPESQSAETPASTDHSGEWFESIEIPVGLLRIGTNVLAIEGHNRWLDDPSFLLAPELSLVASDPGQCR